VRALIVGGADRPRHALRAFFFPAAPPISRRRLTSKTKDAS
jgi:hypothetical protein